MKIMLLLIGLMSTSSFAALSPFYQSAKELQAVLAEAQKEPCGSSNHD